MKGRQHGESLEEGREVRSPSESVNDVLERERFGCIGRCHEERKPNYRNNGVSLWQSEADGAVEVS